MGESSLPRRDGVGACVEAARGNAAMGLLRGVACLGVTEASGSGVVRWLAAVSFAGRRGCSRGYRATCGGHTYEAPGTLCAVVMCPLEHVEGSAFVASLCPVAGWEGCSANTLTVSTGGWPMQLLFAFGLGAGRIAGVAAWK